MKFYIKKKGPDLHQDPSSEINTKLLLTMFPFHKGYNKYNHKILKKKFFHNLIKFFLFVSKKQHD